MKIAVILPLGKSDYLANTIIDGLADMIESGEDISLAVTENYPSPIDINQYSLSKDIFLNFANEADMVILVWGKNSTNFDLAEKIDRWDKTVFIDGSELGKNNRFYKDIQESVLSGDYGGIGRIDNQMLSKCRLYFRREKPYINGIIPLPFGIERRYRIFFNKNITRDIDFTCVFGQDEYPILRREARKYLESFCKKNKLICYTKKTKGFNFDDDSKRAGRDEFYEVLSRTKVGISIGGGGFDTARFWEILASGAILLTEKIDIYKGKDEKLDYKRIIQFTDLEDFKIKLEEIGQYLHDIYAQDIDMLDKEYDEVLKRHSSRARVEEIIKIFKNE